MCAERMQRVVIAIILGMVMGVAATGIAEPESGGLQIAFLVQLVLIIMLLIGGFTRFCPSLMVLRGFLPPCKDD